MALDYNTAVDYNSVYLYNGTGGGYLRTTIRRRTLDIDVSDEVNGGIDRVAESGTIGAVLRVGQVPELTRKGRI
jgi:hypothetical protein